MMRECPSSLTTDGRPQPGMTHVSPMSVHWSRITAKATPTPRLPVREEPGMFAHTWSGKASGSASESEGRSPMVSYAAGVPLRSRTTQHNRDRAANVFLLGSDSRGTIQQVLASEVL
jgi:hypothetical protein